MAKPKILQQLNAEKESKILLASNPTVDMEAATKQYVDNSGGTFYATYGETTFNEITEALNKEKAVKVVLDDTYIGNLVGKGKLSSNNNQGPTQTVQGYTDLLGIYSDGNQYIDTNLVPNENTRIVIDFMATQSPAKHVFGARTAFQDNAFLCCWENNFDYCCQYAGSTYNGGSFTALDVRHTVEMTSSSFKVDGTTTATYTSSSISPSGNLYLFSCSNSDIPAENMIGTIYSCKIYQNNNLVRDYIPVRQDSTEKNGLYDKVNNVFYTDVAGGNFTAQEINNSSGESDEIPHAFIVPILGFNEIWVWCHQDNTWEGEYDSQVTSETYLYHPIEYSMYRRIQVDTSEPTASDGSVGDIWLVYED